MSLIGQLAGEAFTILTSSASGGATPAAQIITDLIQNHPSGNGLTGLLEQLAASGLGPQVQSWLGSGANLPVSGDQIQQALGPEKIQQLAQQYGIDASSVAAVIAHVMPGAVDHLTPNGQVPPANGIAGALSGLLNSSFFKQ
jgi:uncharacterized protein YidB (DUF937 family)